MDAILSVRPKYAEAILNGEKRFEFRKRVFKNRDVEKVFIYSTSPTRRIVGSFRIGSIIEDHPKNLWNRAEGRTGLDSDEFFSYFEGCEVGFAIQIDSPEKYDEPIDPRSCIPNFSPPQSFCYLKSTIPNGTAGSQ